MPLAPGHPWDNQSLLGLLLGSWVLGHVAAGRRWVLSLRPEVVRAADRRRAEGDREVRDAPVVVRVPVVVSSSSSDPPRAADGTAALERDRERQDLRHDDVEGDGRRRAPSRARLDDRARAPRECTAGDHGIARRTSDDTLLAAFCARRWHTGSYQRSVVSATATMPLRSFAEAMVTASAARSMAFADQRAATQAAGSDVRRHGVVDERRARPLRARSPGPRGGRARVRP